jgi:hypothetical protein
MFGNGIVRGIDQNKLTIEFSENVTKEIIAGYVKRRSSPAARLWYREARIADSTARFPRTK